MTNRPGELVRSDGTRLWFEVRPARAGGGEGHAGDVAGGRRQVVVLAPPGGRNAAYWAPSFLDELAAAGLDVVRFDWRGQGRSDWGSDPGVETTADVLADDLDALCDTVTGDGGGPVTLHLVGVGLGGWVAARVAARRRADPASPAPADSMSNRCAVGRLVLAGTSEWYCDPTLPGPTEPVVVALVLRRRGGGATGLVRSLAREVAVEAARPGPVDAGAHLEEAERWLAHGFNPADEHRPIWLAAPPLGSTAEVWSTSEMWSTGEARPADLAGDVVVVHGELDPVVPLVHGRRLAERLAASFHVVPGAGHHPDAAMLAALARAVLAPPVGSAEWPPSQG